MKVLFDIPLAVLPWRCALFAGAALALVLVWASVVDIRRRTVPRGAVAASVFSWAVAFGAMLLSCQDVSVWQGGMIASIAGAAVALGFAFLCGRVLSHVRKRTALGFGDVKILFVLGLYCGASGALTCLFTACVLAALYSGIRFLADACMRFVFERRPTCRLRRIPPFDGTFPFVPFLAVSFVLFAMPRLLL